MRQLKKHSEEESNENNGDAGEAVASPVMQQAIYNQIRALRSDLKSEMSEFRLSFCNDMKKELNEFRGETNRKLQEAPGELQATIASAYLTLKNGTRSGGGSHSGA